jgi:hypothetical protein
MVLPSLLADEARLSPALAALQRCGTAQQHAPHLARNFVDEDAGQQVPIPGVPVPHRGQRLLQRPAAVADVDVAHDAHAALGEAPERLAVQLCVRAASLGWPTAAACDYRDGVWARFCLRKWTVIESCTCCTMY